MEVSELYTRGHGKGEVALKNIGIPPGVDKAEMVASSRELNALW